MRVRRGWIAATVVGLTIAVTAGVKGQAPAQQPPPTEGHGGPPPPGEQPPAQAPRPRPQGGGFPQGPARFPAHQRPPADPAVVERGRGLYVGACGACHGADARGGQLGGPNLLRSELVLNDRDGELIFPVVKNGRPGTLMPPMPMPEADVKTIATYLHHLQSQGTNQGGPPPGEAVELNILVGDPKAGATYFASKCTACHSADGDLKGLASRVTQPMALQNLWVSGGRAMARGRGFRPPSDRAAVTATVSWPSGETVKGRLVRIDDFLVTIGQADGTTRTIRRVGEVPTVEIDDPLEGHRELLGVLTDTDMHDVTAYLATLK